MNLRHCRMSYRVASCELALALQCSLKELDAFERDESALNNTTLQLVRKVARIKQNAYDDLQYTRKEKIYMAIKALGEQQLKQHVYGY